MQDNFQSAFPLQLSFSLCSLHNWQLKSINTCGASLCVHTNLWKQLICNRWHFSTVWLAIHEEIVTSLTSPEKTGAPSPYQNKKQKITLGRSVHSGQFSNLGWKLRISGPISWFHFCCSQNPSPSSSTWWTEDLGGSILMSLKPATRSRKYQTPWYGFKREHTVHLCKQLNQESKT